MAEISIITGFPCMSFHCSLSVLIMLSFDTLLALILSVSSEGITFQVKICTDNGFTKLVDSNNYDKQTLTK